MVVNFRHEGQIAIVTVDNPPVNALSKAVRVGLLDALKKSEALKSVEAVLLMCAGRTFIAGADISEFAKPLEAPYLFYIINEIEKATKPWIAVLHGTVLGGGLEIALGCHYRIATSTTKLGLPEVTLGLIPGAGGTVRLPRLIGAVAALEMVTSGKPVIAQRAMDIGLIDKVSKTNIKDMAFEFVIGCILKPLPQPIIDRPFPVNVDKVKWANQIERICASSHGQNAPLAAIRCIENALRLTPLDALSIERDIFLEQMSDPQSKALQYIFFAERSSGKLPEIKGIKPRPLDQVGIVGSGEMSSGVAAVCLIFGLNLIMIEPDDKAADSARKLIRNKLCYAKKQSVITDAEIKLMLDRLKFGEKYNELSSVDFVIDAMFENSEQKRTVFAELEQVMRPDAIIARIASHRDPNIFSVPMHDPSRVIGLHFFLSAYSTKLMELVVTTSASPDVLATGVAFGKKLQKITIPTAICGGSIGNRISYGCLSECYNMIDAGAFPWEIDQAMRSYGFSIGIFEMEDL
jgi:3-hydroxyacyl-CoA dehydrogenase